MTEVKITSKRLQLRLIERSDLDAIHQLHSLAEVDEYNTLGIPENIEATKAIIEPWIKEGKRKDVKNYTFAIEDKSTKQFIGLFGLKLGSDKFKSAEVWYKLHPDFWRKGYATEALNTVLDFCFETLKLHRIEAGCAVNNIGSINVLEKAGMTREGRKRQVLPLKTGWSDNFEYAILESDSRAKN